MSTTAPSLDASSRRWALVAAGSCLLPLLLQLPGALAASAGIAAVVVALLSWRRPLPAWLRLVLVVALAGAVLSVSRFSFGRDTACAMLAAMLAIKPAETFNLRDARSLVGFALFAPFATFLLDQGPVALGLGLVGATLALAALLRLAELDTPSAGSMSLPEPAPTVSPLRRVGSVWRLIAIGLPLALAAFWLFPRLAAPLWGVPERAMARPGLSDDMAPGEWLELMNDDRTALRVQFFGATPPQSQMYWRASTLLDFDGRRWTRARWLGDLPGNSADAERRREMVIRCALTLARHGPVGDPVRCFCETILASWRAWPDLEPALIGMLRLLIGLPHEQLASSWSLVLALRQNAARQTGAMPAGPPAEIEPGEGYDE